MIKSTKGCVFRVNEEANLFSFKSSFRLSKKEILFFLALSIIIFKDCSPIPLLGRLIILSNAKSS